MQLLQFIGLCSMFLCSESFFFVPGGGNSVHTPVGEILGSTYSIDVRGRRHQVRQFLGIPYAEAPVGDRRFRKPVPKAPFAKPFNASTSSQTACFQIRNDPKYRSEVSEDCLTLNIFVPNGVTHSGTGESLSVMIFIHGGGFYAGSSNFYMGNTLSAFGNVIVVTVNYRLAAMGFLSTGDSNSPGNYGLWDQHLAIKWVHDNIQAFGGNRSSVTIFGESAGSTSVIYQALYPGNRGLIHRAIAESGSITSFWGFTKDYKSSLMAFAGAAGCTRNTNTEIMACLRSKTSDELFLLATTINDTSIIYLWKPVVDGEFIVEDPELMLKGRHLSSAFRSALQAVDLMISVNNLDGGLVLPAWAFEYGLTSADALLPTKQQFIHLLSDSLKSILKHDPPSIVNDAVVFQYTNWTREDGQTRLASLFSMVTDHSLYAPTIKTFRAHQGTGRSYLCQFAVKPSSGHLIPVPGWMDGSDVANHADELLFVFGFDPEMLAYQRKYYEPGYGSPSAEDMEIAYGVMALWSNFAQTGDPHSPRDVKPFLQSTWPQYDPRGQKYLEITPTMGPGSVKERLAAKAVQFWLDLVPALMEAATCQ